MTQRDKVTEWNKKYPKGKASLAWNLSDFLVYGEEPPSCVLSGKTEGEMMDRDFAIKWIQESMRFLRVFSDEYPEKYDQQFNIFILDLEYLASLGKITAEELKELRKEENFNFEEPE